MAERNGKHIVGRMFEDEVFRRFKQGEPGMETKLQGFISRHLKAEISDYYSPEILKADAARLNLLLHSVTFEMMSTLEEFSTIQEVFKGAASRLHARFEAPSEDSRDSLLEGIIKAHIPGFAVREDILIAWDPTAVSPKEYAELVRRIGDLVRSQGGAGLWFLGGATKGVVSENLLLPT